MPINDCIGDIRCVATTHVPQERANAASAKREKRMTGLSASYQFVHRAANGRNRRALLSLVGQIKLSDSASAIYPHQLDDDIDRLLNVLPHLSEVQRRARLQDHYC